MIYVDPTGLDPTTCGDVMASAGEDCSNQFPGSGSSGWSVGGYGNGSGHDYCLPVVGCMSWYDWRSYFASLYQNEQPGPACQAAGGGVARNSNGGGGGGGGAKGKGGNSSWLGIFTKEFFKFSGGPGNVPTCAEIVLKNIAQEFFPFSPDGASVIQATAPAAQAMAFNSAVAQTTASVDAYVAARGLTVPLRSGVVRGMIAQGAEGAVAAGAKANVAIQTLAVDYAAIKSDYLTTKEALSGWCAAAFPTF